MDHPLKESDPSFDIESNPTNPSFETAKNRFEKRDQNNNTDAIQEFRRLSEQQDAKVGISNSVVGESHVRSFEEDVPSDYQDEEGSADPVIPSEQKEAPILGHLNIVNLVAYVSNAVAVYVLGASGLFDLPTNAEIAALYPTLVTPAAYAFGIWAIIFGLQGIWAVLQMLPSYRAHPLVVDGVSFWYILVCLAQITWSTLFTLEQILPSVVAMTVLLVLLLIIFLKISKMQSDSTTAYAFLKLPFEIHTAWILAASLINANLLLVDLEVDKSMLVLAAAVTVTALAVLGIVFAMMNQWVIPLVLAWASMGIAVELSNANNVWAVEKFSSSAIASLEFASGGLAAVLCMLVLVRLFVLAKNDVSGNTKTVSEEENDYVKM